MHERIKLLRKTLKLTQQEFAERIGVKRNTIATYEIGRNEPIDAVFSLICREFNINEEWLKNGTGEMFKETFIEDEIAAYVSDLIEEDNEFYTIIKEIMHTYSELTPKSQQVLQDFSKNLLTNLKKTKKED